MKALKFILIFSVLFIITACSKKQLSRIYNDDSIFMTTPSVDEFDKVKSSKHKPTYEEYRNKY
ncbi:MAG: Unknown protein [uncultured Sulfurovum sp.]|uniref:Lipoprotein n=1 Tax=uncultured Sulfurovum sp. TaxID=269237 RepID=A0A6S6TKM6_9BACT|nr:MAG: Unknown protein [uncultured Sulfurovum sp.]